MNLLLVEDDDVFAARLSQDLTALGHSIMRVGRGRLAASAIAQQGFDALILDRVLPDGDGALHLAQWRATAMAVPAILLTGLAETDDRIDGLDLGADDYLIKPVDARELDARLRAIIRRSHARPDSDLTLTAGPIRVDRLRREVWHDDHQIRLQPREFRILEELALARGDIVTKRMLLKSIWNFDFDTRTKLVETHMSRLREKLGQRGAGELIETVRGSGYRLRMK